MNSINSLKFSCIIIYLFCCFMANASIYPYNFFKIDHQNSEASYQQYIGKTIVFYKPVTSNEENFNLKKISFGTPYIIEAITVKGLSYDAIVTFSIREKGNQKAKMIQFKCKNGVGLLYEKSVYDIPAYFTDMLDEAKAKYIGKKLLISGSEYSITDVILEPKFFEEINETNMASTFVYIDKNGNEIKEDMYSALKGGYKSELVKVEKPVDEAVRYGETSVIEDDGVTKYSYVDNIINILIFGDKEQFNFILKNVSDNSIKIVWNEAAFVGIDGVTSKIMHSGIKYSQREADQPATVIIRGAKLEDIAAPTDLIYYSDILREWTSRSMYPSKAGANGQVTLMLPIQIKETINEYLFVFNVVYKYAHPELH